MRPGRDTLWNAAVVSGAVAFAWLCTTPSAVVLINWDNAAYIAEMASGGYTWSHLPWSSHLGVGQEYKLGVWLAQAFGGTVIDGFRVVNAFFFAATCWVLFDTCRRVCASRAQAIALTALWATAWVNLHYHLILEDNFLFLAPCAVMLRICVLRVDAWRPRDSLLAGMFCLLGLLGSYQALPYFFAAGYAALLAPRRDPLVRVRDGALVVVGFAATLLAWMVFTVGTSRLSWKALSGQVFMGPVPNYLPRSPALLLKYFLDGHSVLETLGNGVLWNLSFHAYVLPFESPIHRSVLGIIALLLLLAVFVWATRWSLRTGHLAPHLLSATLLLLTFATSIHKDEVEYTGLKRYDFVPLILIFLAACLLGELRKRPLRDLYAKASLTLMLVAVTAQLALGLRWSVVEQARYVARSSWNSFPHSEAMQYGREGKSWFRYFRDLEREHRHACTLVLSYGEIADSTWNFDIIGSLYSEVPSHVVVANDYMISRFRPSFRRVVPNLVHPEAASIPPCAWVSQEARQLLAAVHH